MKTTIKSLALIAIALVSGAASSYAQEEEDEGVELTKDMWKKYDSTGKEAQPTDETVYLDWNIGTSETLESGAVLAGTSTVTETVFADLSEYSKMIIYADPGNSGRFMFNRMVAGGQANTGDMIEIYKTVSDEGDVTIDLKNEMLRGADGADKELDDFAHLVTIKVPWGGSAKIDAILLFKEDGTSAIKNIAEAGNDVVVATYNLAGETVSAQTKGLVIKKLKSGKVVKVVNE